jgi:integrase
MGYIRKQGRKYWIRYYRDGERFDENTFTSDHEEAQRILKQREGHVADGRPVSPKANRLTFDDAAADLETEYLINGRKSLSHVQRRLTLHLMPFFTGQRLLDIDSPAVRAYIKARLTAGAANASINRELAILKRLFRLAKQGGRYLGDVPHIPMQVERNTRKGFFERAQFDAVKDRLPAALQPLVEFAYLTGWRVKSEILPLEWRHIDWTDRVVRLDPGTTKNEEGRTFPFTAAIETVLQAQLMEHQTLKQAGRIVPLVFHRNGKPILHFYKAWQTACTAAGVPGKLLHDFRRTAVKNLERDGVSRSAAMAMVGHKTESIYRRYAIVDAGALREAAAKIDRAAGVVPTPVSASNMIRK